MPDRNPVLGRREFRFAVLWPTLVLVLLVIIAGMAYHIRVMPHKQTTRDAVDDHKLSAASMHQAHTKSAEPYDPEAKARIINAARILFAGPVASSAGQVDLCVDMQWVYDAQDIMRMFSPGTDPAPIQWAEVGIDATVARAKFETISLRTAKTLMDIWVEKRAVHGAPEEMRSCEGTEAPWGIEDEGDVRRSLMRIIFFMDQIELRSDYAQANQD